LAYNPEGSGQIHWRKPGILFKRKFITKYSVKYIVETIDNYISEFIDNFIVRENARE